MKKEPLNHEAIIYSKSGKTENFYFHGDSLASAKEHVRHVLFTESDYTYAVFRNVSAYHWRTIRKTDYR